MAPSWSATVEGLDMYVDGEVAKYTWVEGDFEYKDKYTELDPTTNTDKTVYTLHNMHETETTSASVKKKWTDNDNQDGYRPESLTVKLLANGQDTGKSVTLTPDAWEDSITGLDKKANGADIEYTWVEENFEHKDKYTEVTPHSVSGTVTTIENIHETETISVSVKKKWTDNDNQDGYRPESLTVKLLANGQDTGKSVTLTPDAWEDSITGLDKKANGADIEYTWVEENFEHKDKYTEVTPHSVSGTVTTIENIHETETISVSVKKKWTDNDNQDGYRPESLTVKLLANGQDTGKSVTLTPDAWEDSITGLDKKANGADIEYTWEEESFTNEAEYTEVTPHDVSGTLTTIENIHISEIINILVRKAWDDKSNQDGVRPDSILIQLFANGEQVYEVSPVPSKDNPDEWTYLFEELPKKAAGKDIKYTVTETDKDHNATIAEYVMNGDPVWNDDGSVVTVTNSHSIAKTHICVKKDWQDEEDVDDYRPDQVIIQLLAKKGNESSIVATHYLTVEDPDWTYDFTDLDKYYDQGKPIIYSIQEVEVDEEHYESTTSKIDDENYVVTNKHDPDKIDIQVTKDWQDNDNQDGLREPVVITLVKDGEIQEEETITLTKDNKWTAVFEGLQKNKLVNGKGGNRIEYTVAELEVPEGYELIDITGDMDNGYTVINEHKPETITISGEKVWDTEANKYGFTLPESINVILKANGEKVDEKIVTPDENGNWTYSFEGYDKYKAGEEITYTIDETPIFDYSVEPVKGTYNIKNTYTPETTDVVLHKIWDDKNDQDGLRPKDEYEVDIVGYVDDGETEVYRETVVLSGNVDDSEWTATYEGFPVYANGKEITWVAEEPNMPEGYERTDEKITVEMTNFHSPEVVSYYFEKNWADDDNHDGFRPASVTIRVFDDLDKEAGMIVLSEENEWSGSIDNLPLFRDHGTPIQYRVVEDSVDEYTSEVVETEDNSYVVVNTHETKKLNIHIIKTWEDEDNKLLLRPDKILVDIFANGELLDTVTITAEDNWEYDYEVDAYKDGQEIVYELREQPLENYIPSYNDFNIINKVNGGNEIVPPDTGIYNHANAGAIYFLIAILSIIVVGFRKIYE